jgi:hypothetical protein
VVVTERDDLRAILELCRDVSTRFKPRRLAIGAEHWLDWVPISWQAQAEELVAASADALGIARFGLTKQLSASALGPVRFVIETHCLVDWLLSDPSRRDARCLGIALKEVGDWRRTLRSETRDPDALAEFNRYLKARDDEELAGLDEVEHRISARATSAGVEPEIPPRTLQALMDRIFQGDVAYRFFSDLGSHVGLGLTFLFNGPEGSSPDHHTKSVMFRAFCLGLALGVYLDTAEVVAAALDQGASVERIRTYRAGQIGLLERVVVRDSPLGPLYGP